MLNRMHATAKEYNIPHYIGIYNYIAKTLFILEYLIRIF